MSYQSRLSKVALVLASVATVIVAGYATPLAWTACRPPTSWAQSRHHHDAQLAWLRSPAALIKLSGFPAQAGWDFVTGIGTPCVVVLSAAAGIQV
ncbi:hypothetical protein ARMGADRAFT_1080894 [Armillaria gallica]|uniref:Uncharacterized protein n=1 Tax=Armillaria gallica TaxID=47427 RepID=A0A2H3DV03_ARMGA|nr:hypothetical protein ARMGADRAFT_1080894 [Armillaria gallica]